MKLPILAVVLLLFTGRAFGQQSGTTTECENKYNGITCKTTPSPPTLGEIINRNLSPKNPQQAAATAPPSGLSPEAVKAILAEEKAQRDAKDTVDFLYCRQNPKGSVTNDGTVRPCADVIEYTKAFCSVNTDAERCNLAKSKAEVDRAFAALVSEYNTNSHRNKPWEQGYFGEKFAKLTRWGCMSFSDLTLPQRDGASHACPNAPDVDATTEKKQ